MRVAVRLTPRARAGRIDGVAAGALKVSVTAPPAENQANEALLRLLAKKWRLPRRNLSLAAGAKSRNKVVHIAGDAAELMARRGAAHRGRDLTGWRRRKSCTDPIVVASPGSAPRVAQGQAPRGNLLPSWPFAAGDCRGAFGASQ